MFTQSHWKLWAANLEMIATNLTVVAVCPVYNLSSSLSKLLTQTETAVCKLQGVLFWKTKIKYHNISLNLT